MFNIFSPNSFSTLQQGDNQTEAGEAGAIEAILKAIDENIRDGSVCENGCGALWNIALNSKITSIYQHTTFSLFFHSKKRLEKNKIKAGKLRTIEVILKVLKVQMGDPAVWETGCSALCAIVMGNGK